MPRPPWPPPTLLRGFTSSCGLSEGVRHRRLLLLLFSGWPCGSAGHLQRNSPNLPFLNPFSCPSGSELSLIYPHGVLAMASRAPPPSRLRAARLQLGVGLVERRFRFRCVLCVSFGGWRRRQWPRQLRSPGPPDPWTWTWGRAGWSFPFPILMPCSILAPKLQRLQLFPRPS